MYRIMAIVFTFFILLTVGCEQLGISTQHDKVVDVLSKPGSYKDRVVVIKGTVTTSFLVFEKGFFMLNDGTDSIIVLPAKTFPKTNDTVIVKGKIKNAFTIGSTTKTVLIESTYF